MKAAGELSPDSCLPDLNRVGSISNVKLSSLASKLKISPVG